jgi:adenosine deaminase
MSTAGVRSPRSSADLAGLPKVELHRHLDGSVRISTIHELAQERGVAAGSLAEQRARAIIERPLASLDAVLACFAEQQAALWSFDAIRRVTFENIEDAWRDGVRLIELRFAPAFIAAGKRLSNDEIIGAVLAGMRQGMSSWPIEVGLIGILPRRFSREENARATRDLIRWRHSGEPGADRICGFDLADGEDDSDPAAFAALVEQARDAGLGITVHSGENTTPAHVARTLDTLRPSRIGHGIRSWGDNALLERLRREDVLLEISPTSNWITSSVPSLAEHPLPLLHRAGVPVCLNSDDPNLFGIDLVHEYETCAREYGFGVEDFRAMNRAALRHSFLPPQVKARIEKEI